MNAETLIRQIISSDARATDEEVTTALSMLSEEEKKKFQDFVLAHSANPLKEKVTQFCKEASECLENSKNLTPETLKSFYERHKSFASRFPIQMKYILNKMFVMKVFRDWVNRHISNITMVHASTEHIDAWIDMNVDFSVKTFIHYNPRINKEHDLRSVRESFEKNLRQEHMELMEYIKIVEKEKKERMETLKTQLKEELTSLYETEETSE